MRVRLIDLEERKQASRLMDYEPRVLKCVAVKNAFTRKFTARGSGGRAWVSTEKWVRSSLVTQRNCK